MLKQVWISHIVCFREFSVNWTMCDFLHIQDDGIDVKLAPNLILPSNHFGVLSKGHIHASIQISCLIHECQYLPLFLLLMSEALQKLAQAQPIHPRQKSIAHHHQLPSFSSFEYHFLMLQQVRQWVHYYKNAYNQMLFILQGSTYIHNNAPPPTYTHTHKKK